MQQCTLLLDSPRVVPCLGWVQPLHLAPEAPAWSAQALRRAAQLLLAWHHQQRQRWACCCLLLAWHHQQRQRCERCRLLL